MQVFIDLVSRHEQAFYTFVHNVHSKGAGLFDNLMRWIERFLTVMRDGIGATSGVGADIEGMSQKISLETLLPAGGEERAAVFAEVDKVARYHYAMKVAHEERVRSRFGRSQGGTRNGSESTDITDEEAQALVNSVMSEFNFGELAKGNADELFAEETDESDEDEDESGEETDEDDDSSEFGTDSEEDEEISAESLPSKLPPSGPSHSPSIHTTPPRSSRMTYSQHPLSQKPTHIPFPSVSAVSQLTYPEARQRSFSLRNARSMTFLKDKDKERDPPPPVPPLPTRFEKPLPPRPLDSSLQSPPPGVLMSARRSSSEQSSVHSRQSSVRQIPPTSGLSSPRSAPRKKAKNDPVGLQPPELKQIPLLLPVFVEMVCLFGRPQCFLLLPLLMSSPDAPVAPAILTRVEYYRRCIDTCILTHAVSLSQGIAHWTVFLF